MWMTIILLYWLLCGAVMLAVERLRGPCNDADQEDCDRGVKELFGLLGFDPLVIDAAEQRSREFREPGSMPLSMEVFYVAISPILLPMVFGWLGYCEVREAMRQRRVRKTARMFREYQFQPVNSLHLPKWIQLAWDQHTPELFQAGFDLLGDFLMKPEPLVIHDRFFVSDQGDMLASVCCLLEFSALSLESVLADGTFIETANCTNHAPERSIVPTDRTNVVWLPGVTFAELLTEHRDRLQSLIGEQAADVVRIDGDNFQTVLNHNQRVFCRWRYRHGDLDQPPPLPDFEQFATMPTVSQSEPMAPPRLACRVAAKVSDGNSQAIACEAV